jgi:thiamine transporter
LPCVPLIISALRRGLGWGLGAGLVFGTLEFFFAGGEAVNWQSMLLDYSLAYMAVGFAGLAAGSGNKGYYWGPFVGCAARFIVHFISGVTIYAQYMPENFMGLTMTSPTIYSILFNATYMLPNTVIAVAVCILLMKPMQKVPK